ncbi:MAG: alpha/beta hydrolase [Rhizobiaceae bacterium]|nr:alpha/beta hydrolase [Rhizobiaceae bacterium]MCV0406003.1 alpha/beta hydrolase [Rhizobiaceae bacterium]
MWNTEGPLSIVAGGAKLEARCWGPPPGRARTVVLLHEGLGSTGLWRDFPQKLAQASGHGVFAFSRRGYGASDPADLPRPVDYMTREALDVLPEVLDRIGFEKGVLAGHSDGATIAAIHAGTVQDHRVRGVVLIAPHFFTEPEGLASIAEARVAYETGGLKEKLARHHADPDNAFRGWNDAWLTPAFHDWNVEEVIAYIRVPVLAIQGTEDRYGTRAQIAALEDQIYSPLDVEMIEGCGHSPHAEAPDRTLAVIADYLARLERIDRPDLAA